MDKKPYRERKPAILKTGFSEVTATRIKKINSDDIKTTLTGYFTIGPIDGQLWVYKKQ